LTLLVVEVAGIVFENQLGDSVLVIVGRELDTELELVMLEEKGLSVTALVVKVDDDVEVVERVLTLAVVVLEKKRLSVIEEVEKTNDDADELVVLTGTGLIVIAELTVTVLKLESGELVVFRLVVRDVWLLLMISK